MENQSPHIGDLIDHLKADQQLRANFGGAFIHERESLTVLLTTDSTSWHRDRVATHLPVDLNYRVLTCDFSLGYLEKLQERVLARSQASPVDPLKFMMIDIPSNTVVIAFGSDGSPEWLTKDFAGEPIVVTRWRFRLD